MKHKTLPFPISFSKVSMCRPFSSNTSPYPLLWLTKIIQKPPFLSACQHDHPSHFMGFFICRQLLAIEKPPLGKTRHGLNKAKEYSKRALGCALNEGRHNEGNARPRQQHAKISSCSQPAACSSSLSARLSRQQVIENIGFC